MTVEFAPDHPRKSFTDKLHIDINSKVDKTLEDVYCTIIVPLGKDVISDR